jgi:hypothetical protein
VQRGEDRDRGIDAGEQIGGGDPGLLRRTVGLAGDRHHPAHPLNDEVVAGARRVGAGLAEARYRADDQPRVARAQRRRVEPVFDEAAELVILDHHVRTGGERGDARLARGRGDIDRDRALAAIARVIVSRGEVRAVVALDEGRPPVARVVALAGPLDLDHVRAQIGEQLPRPGAGEDARQFEHAQAGEGAGSVGHRSGVAARGAVQKGPATVEAAAPAA